MAQKTAVRSSNLFPLKAGRQFLEVEFSDSDPSPSGRVSDFIYIGRHRSIKPVMVSDSSASVAAEGGGVRISYKADSPVTIHVQLEIEQGEPEGDIPPPVPHEPAMMATSSGKILITQQGAILTAR